MTSLKPFPSQDRPRENVRPAKKPIAIFDWDGTLVRGFTILRWIEFLAHRRLFPAEGLNYSRTLLESVRTHAISYRTFVLRLTRTYSQGVRGLQAGEVRQLSQLFSVTEEVLLLPYASTAIKWLQSRGVGVVVLTGSPKEVVVPFIPALGLTQVFGLTIEAGADERYTGKIELNPGLARTKKRILSAICEGHEVLFGFGDTPADVPILQGAKLGLFVTSNGSRINSLGFKSIDGEDRGASSLISLLKQYL